MCNWISVDERLPEPDPRHEPEIAGSDTVFVLEDGGNPNIGSCNGRTWLVGESEYISKRVTHWMSVPSPNSGDGNGREPAADADREQGELCADLKQWAASDDRIGHFSFNGEDHWSCDVCDPGIVDTHLANCLHLRARKEGG